MRRLRKSRSDAIAADVTTFCVLNDVALLPYLPELLTFPTQSGCLLAPPQRAAVLHIIHTWTSACILSHISLSALVMQPCMDGKAHICAC